MAFTVYVCASSSGQFIAAALFWASGNSWNVSTLALVILAGMAVALVPAGEHAVDPFVHSTSSRGHCLHCALDSPLHHQQVRARGLVVCGKLAPVRLRRFDRNMCLGLNFRVAADGLREILLQWPWACSTTTKLSARRVRHCCPAATTVSSGSCVTRTAIDRQRCLRLSPITLSLYAALAHKAAVRRSWRYSGRTLRCPLLAKPTKCVSSDCPASHADGEAGAPGHKRKPYSSWTSINFLLPAVLLASDAVFGLAAGMTVKCAPCNCTRCQGHEGILRVACSSEQFWAANPVSHPLCCRHYFPSSLVLFCQVLCCQVWLSFPVPRPDTRDLTCLAVQ